MKRLKILSIIFGIIFITFASYALTYQIKTQTVSVGNTATKLPTTPLVGRQYVSLQNIGTVTVYWGASDVTTSNGKQLLPYATATRDYDNTVDVYGIVASGSCSVIVEEGK